jgi:hypothetical protein
MVIYLEEQQLWKYIVLCSTQVGQYYKNKYTSDKITEFDNRDKVIHAIGSYYNRHLLKLGKGRMRYPPNSLGSYN